MAAVSETHIVYGYMDDDPNYKVRLVVDDINGLFHAPATQCIAVYEQQPNGEESANLRDKKDLTITRIVADSDAF